MGTQFFKVAYAEELKDGEMKLVTPNGKEILLAMINGEYFAIDNLCPHAWGMLDQGTLHGYEIQCPLHVGRFDVRTGEATHKPATEPVNTYPVKLEDDTILVGVTFDEMT